MKVTGILCGLLILSATVIFLPGCKKNDTNNKKADVTAATDNALANNVYGDVKNWSDKAMAGAKLKSSLSDTVYMGTCVLATLDLNVFPFKLTIDFGPVNCKCDDGVYRRGKMFVTVNGDYWQPGTVITYTFENFFMADNQVLGTKTITNNGRNNSGHLSWTTVVAGSIVKANNGGTITYNENTVLEWLEGEATTWMWWDDVYQMTGFSNGTNSDGKTYSCTITNPLKKKLNCEWIQSGTMEIQPQDSPLIILDFGSGACDDQATATVNGTVYPITMP
ncbi:MAG: hypothetical protein NTU98_09805 [Bacteroidetes bacterium]|nr:hypothetical protein [Bacteroidota bacterium]